MFQLLINACGFSVWFYIDFVSFQFTLFNCVSNVENVTKKSMTYRLRQLRYSCLRPNCEWCLKWSIVHLEWCLLVGGGVTLCWNGDRAHVWSWSIWLQSFAFLARLSCLSCRSAGQFVCSVYVSVPTEIFIVSLCQLELMHFQPR